LERVVKVDTPAPFCWYGHITLMGKEKLEECCLVALDHSSNLHAFKLMNLEPILTTKKWNVENFGLHCSVETLAATLSGKDGFMLLFSTNTEVFRAALFPTITEREMASPILHLDNIKAPEKPKSKGLKGFFGSKSPDLSAVLGTPQGPTQTQTKKDKPEVSKVQSKTNETKNILSETKEKLNERGEKLGELADKTEDLNNASAEFLANVRELVKKQKSKKWYEF